MDPKADILYNLLMRCFKTLSFILFKALPQSTLSFKVPSYELDLIFSTAFGSAYSILLSSSFLCV